MTTPRRPRRVSRKPAAPERSKRCPSIHGESHTSNVQGAKWQVVASHVLKRRSITHEAANAPHFAPFHPPHCSWPPRPCRSSPRRPRLSRPPLAVTRSLRKHGGIRRPLRVKVTLTDPRTARPPHRQPGVGRFFQLTAPRTAARSPGSRLIWITHGAVRASQARTLAPFARARVTGRKPA